VASGQPLGTPLQGSASIAFSPDGKILASGDRENTIVLWDLDPAVWQAQACRIANRNLTREEWKQYLGDEPYEVPCPGLPGPGK